MTQPKSKKEEFFEKLNGYGFSKLCDQCEVEGCNQEMDEDMVWQFITDNFVPKEKVKEIVEEALFKGYDLRKEDVIEQYNLIEFTSEASDLIEELLSKHNIND